MNNANEPVVPVDPRSLPSLLANGAAGLRKRELFTAIAMHGLIVKSEPMSSSEIGRKSVEIADHTLLKLRPAK